MFTYNYDYTLLHTRARTHNPQTHMHYTYKTNKHKLIMYSYIDKQTNNIFVFIFCISSVGLHLAMRGDSFVDSAGIRTRVLGMLTAVPMP